MHKAVALDVFDVDHLPPPFLDLIRSDSGSANPADEIRITPNSSRIPNGSPAKMAAEMVATLISIIKNNPTTPGLSWVGP